MRSVRCAPSITTTRSGALQVDVAVLDALAAGAPTRRLVLVTVGRADLRTARALEYAWRIPAVERRALHVAVDEAELWDLGREWMGRDEPLRLHTVEVDGDVAATLARVVELELASGFDEVVVVTGRLALRRWHHRLLHDRTAEAIARSVARIPQAIVALLTVATI